MGLISTLAQLGGYAAAPFTGGASIPVGQAIAQVAGGLSQGSANQRGAENNQAAERNRLLAQLYGTKQNATLNALDAGSREARDQRSQALDERKYALSAPSVRAGQSVRGSIMANAQPVTISGIPSDIHVPTISGGLSPALFNANTRALGDEMTRKALVDQLKGDDFAPMEKTDFKSGILADPKMEAYQKAGLLEKILGGIGMVGSVAGAASQFGAKGFGAGGNGRVYDPTDQNGFG